MSLSLVNAPVLLTGTERLDCTVANLQKHEATRTLGRLSEPCIVITQDDVIVAWYLPEALDSRLLVRQHSGIAFPPMPELICIAGQAGARDFSYRAIVCTSDSDGFETFLAHCNRRSCLPRGSYSPAGHCKFESGIL